MRRWRSAVSLIPLSIGMLWAAFPLGAIVIPVISFFLGVIPAGILYCGKRVIDGVELWIGGSVNEGQHFVFCFIGLGVILSILQHGMSRLNAFFQELLRLHLVRHIQAGILTKSIGLDLGTLETPQFHDKLKRAQQEAGFRPYAIVTAMLSILRQGFTICSFWVTLSTLSIWVMPWLFVSVIPALFVQIIHGRRVWRMMYNRTPEERRMNYYQSLLTSIPEAKEIQIFGIGEYLLGQWRDICQRFYRKDRRLAGRRTLAEFAVATVQSVSCAGLYYFAVYRTAVDPLISIGSLVMYQQAMDRSFNAMKMFFYSLATFYENTLYLENLRDFLALEPSSKAGSGLWAAPGQISGNIRFENVTFRYPDMGQDVLKNLSFEIKHGEKVAFVGTNGAGKTTILKLLGRLYNPQSGRITIGGLDIRDIALEKWRDCIGVMFQDFGRYDVTARENIAFGNLVDMASAERLTWAATISGADNCITQMAQGWDTVLGKYFEGGHELSIGQWQRIALARTLMRDAPILILDEPTSALDIEQEKALFEKLDRTSQGKTIMIVSHRPSTIRYADRILIIENGQLLETGTHDELITCGGKYSSMFSEPQQVVPLCD